MLYSFLHSQSLLRASSSDRNQDAFRRSVLSGASKASMYALSVGFPGLEKSSSTPLWQAHGSRSFPVNSGPLPTRMDLGTPRVETASLRTSTTLSALNFTLGSVASDLRPKQSVRAKIRNGH